MVKKKVKRNLVGRTQLARDIGVSPAAITRACKVKLKAALVGIKIDLDHESCVEYIRKIELSKQNPIATGIDERYEEALAHCKSVGKFSGRELHKALKIPIRRSNALIKLFKAANLDQGTIPKFKAKDRVINGYASQNVTKKTEALKNINDEIENGNILHKVPEDIEKFADMTLREVIERFGSDAAFVDWLKATKSIEDINEKRLKNAKTKNELVSRDLINIGIIEPVEEAHIKLLSDGSKTITRRVITLFESGSSIEDIEIKVAKKITEFIRPIKTKVKRIMDRISEE